MLKITNGVNVFEVTRGAFDGIYSRQGYRVMDDKKPAEQEDASGVPEKSEDEKFIDAIIEKPISQWDKTEVKRFAAIKGVDLTGTKSIDEAKDIIKAFLEESEG